MKRIITISISILTFIALHSNAENRYWVGGTGSWNNSKNWSSTTGGNGGASIPSTNDDVIFDQHSFQEPSQVVQVSSHAYCHSINFSSITKKAVLAGNINSALHVSGDFILSSNLLNGFKGTIIFTSTTTNTLINTYSKTIEGKLIFNGQGSWKLMNDIDGTTLSEINIQKGSLYTDGKNIKIGKFLSSSTNFKTLDLGTSEINILSSWDFSNNTNLNFNGLSSRIIFEDQVTLVNYKGGNLRYGSVSTRAGACVPSGNACGTFTISLAGTNVTCNGDADGTATASVVGGTGPFTYTWTPFPGGGQGTPNATGLGSNTYIVAVRDNGTGITCFCTIAISEPAKLIPFELASTQASCNGVCDATADVDQVGGTPGYTYLWAPVPGGGQGTASTTGLCVGPYNVTVTDNNGCTASTTITITEPNVLTAPGSSNNVQCFGGCDGDATVVAAGGTTPYLYDWNGTPAGDGTASITALCPGTYTCTVTDFNGCTASYSTTISEPTILASTAAQTNVSCGGVCDGTATATVSGGNPPYTYTWSNGSTTTTPALTDVQSGLCAASYTCTITDANGCTQSQTYTITQPAVLTASVTPTNISCFGGTNGTAVANVVGGTGPFSYDWNGAAIPTGDGTNTITNLTTGTYTVAITDFNGCTTTATATVSEPTILVAGALGTNITCFGLCNGSVTSTPTGGVPPYSYSWANGGQITPAISAQCAGTYTVTVTDFNLCTATQSITIVEPAALTLPVAQTNASCGGACDGTATAASSGGVSPYTYLWSIGAQTTPGVTALCAATYTVTTTDFSGCTLSSTVTITQPTSLTVTLTATAIACNSQCTSTLSTVIGGGTAPYTYSWSSGPQTTASLTNQCAGSYTVTVTDFNGCTGTASVTVSQPTALNLATNTTNVSCFGTCDGTVAALAGGGTVPYSYLWNPGGQTISSLTNQCAATYTITVTDFNGCTIADTLTITEPAIITPNASVAINVSCSGGNNGSATAAPSGGTSPYTYDWSGSPAGDGTNTITGLVAGTYTVTITDFNLCTASQTVTITQPSVLAATITGSTSSCNICNGTATVAGSGGTPGYTYSWAPTAGPQTTATATGLCPGVTYTVTVRDLNNCTATTTITIVQAVTIIITTSNTTLSCNGICDGAITANPSGGTPGYQYLWSHNSLNTQSISNLCAGGYTVTVTDAIGCFNTASVTLTNPAALSVSTSATNVTCGGALCDGTATATPVGGTGAYSYSWNTIPIQTSQTATNLCAGTYTVTITDINLCTTTGAITITQPTVVADNATQTGPTCGNSDGFIFVSPTGGTPPYSYNWSTLLGSPITGQGTNIITNLAADIYTLTVTDGAGCVYTFTYLLSNLLKPTTAMSHTDITCNGLCDGTATVVASSGVAPYTYDWLPGSPIGDLSPSISALCSGTYTVQVNDFQGCIAFDSISVIEPTIINPNGIIVNETCGGNCNGSITTTISGGVAPYTYVWSPATGTGQGTATYTNLCAATYTLDVTDFNGCTSSTQYTVTTPSTLTLNLDSTNVSCNSACDGTITATVGGGTPPYTYSWPHNGALILPNIINLCPGNYVLIVTDANGCSVTDSVNITEPPVLAATTSQTNITCFGLCDGIASVTASGGTLPYTYLWNPTNDITATINSLCAGAYIVTVTDSNGCTLIVPAINISSPNQLLPNITATNPSCFGSCNGTATSAPTGGTGSTYTYLWNPLNQITAGITGMCDGTYSVDVTDSLGCTVNQSVTLTDPALLNANPSSTAPSCANGCDGVLTATSIGGTPTYTYLWTPGNSTTAIVTNVCPNTYTLVVTDLNNCSDTQTVILNNTLPIDAAISTTTATCGVANGTATINPITGTPPYTYAWVPNVSATNSATGLLAGIYDVTVTDFLGCDSTFNFAINNTNGPTGATDTINDVLCYGGNTGSTAILSVIGGTGPYTYVWNTIPVQPNDTALNLPAGNYFCTITDANGCIYSHPVTIMEPNQITPNEVITDATCTNVCDGAITVIPSGGVGPYTYSWSPGTGTGQGTSTYTNLCAGSYTLTTTDASNCVKLDTFIVGQSNPLTGTITTSLIYCSSACNGSAYATITAGSAPFVYQWNDPLNQTNDTAIALCAGAYSVTITDALGCITTITNSVSEKPAIASNPFVTNAACGVCDGQATLTTTGGTAPYSYLWSNGSATNSSTSLCAGVYTVNITDSAGCNSTASILISNTNGPTGVTITSTNTTCNSLCNGAITAVAPVGGTAPYTYLWVQSGSTVMTQSNLCAGIYYLQITDALGCSLVDSVIITEPNPILANQLITSPTCNLCDGAVTIAPSGGAFPYTLLWNNSSTATTLSNLCAGVYSVVITDNAGCTQSITIPLNSQNMPILSVSNTSVTCNGLCNGTATVVASNGVAPYTYLWNDVSAQTTTTAAALCAGTYFITVTDNNGCVGINNATILEPDSIQFSLPNLSNPLCNSDINGTITVVPSGGTFPYTYLWGASGGTGTTTTPLAAGSYTVTITDGNGCTAAQASTLTDPLILSISNTVTNPSCSTIADGAIDITVSGGTPSYSYQWSGSSTATSQDLTSLLPGTYTITTTDANGCTIADTITLTATTFVLADAGVDTSFCQPGPVLLDASGSVNGVNYQWFLITSTGNVSAGTNDSVYVSPPTGTNTYYVVADNGSGCSDSDTVDVIAFPLPSVDAGNDITIFTGTSTTIGGTPTGPVGSTYLWSPIPDLDNGTIANPIATPEATTTYTVVVTSTDGCVASDTIKVTISPEIITVSGISPNGDGVNDEWIIPNIEQFPDCVVEVYNRWGELLFQSPGYKERWKGVFKGKPLPVGTYYYIINLNDALYPNPYTGPITILR